MASPYVRKLAKEIGKSPKEVEPIWDQAIEIASEDRGVAVDDFGREDYEYAAETVKSMFGMNEKALDPIEFLNSNMSAREYLETVVSGDFSIDRAIYPPEPENVPDEILYDQEDEDEEEDEDDEDGMEEKEVGADKDLIDPSGMSQPDREADSDVPYEDEVDEPEDDGELPDGVRESLQSRIEEIEDEQWEMMDKIFENMDV